jgi:hypothetical protein
LDIQKKGNLNPVVNNIGNTGSRALAIKAMCASCMGCYIPTEDGDNGIEPGFRECIRKCSATHCPLHAFRPYLVKGDGDEDQDST